MRSTTPVALPAGVVEPLTEDAFDEFAFQIAAKLSDAMAREGVRTPAVLRVPTIAVEKTPSTPRMRLFCRTLAEGLADRMAGQIEVAEVTGRTPDLHATITWPAPDATERELVVSIRDEHTGRGLVEEHFPLNAPLSRSQPSPTSSRPAVEQPVRKSPIDIEMRASEIGRAVLARLEDYEAQTVDGHDGRVVFLDEQYDRYFVVDSQRATRNSSGVTAEVRLRAVRGSQRVRYRVIFLDADDRAIGVTPVTPREPPGDAAGTLRAFTRDQRALRYLFLVERD